MSEISSAAVSAGPVIIESTAATSAPSAAPEMSSAAPVVMGALSGAAATVDMRATESPSALLGKAPKMMIKA